MGVVWLMVAGGNFYSSLSWTDAPFRSATTSATAALTSEISLATDPPSSTPAVAFCEWSPLMGASGVADAGADSSASSRSTSLLALAMFC